MKRKSWCTWIMIGVILVSQAAVFATGVKPIEATARSYVLMEGSTGKILMEKEMDQQLPPASITKIMTLLLIHDAIGAGKISWDDTVTISEHAAHMGGSQVFMEPGEEQKVRDLVKCIAVASANDAAVAMAEYIGGSEEQFVQMMNQKAADLGMKSTVFKNACGLHTEGHVSSAHDVALMSRELITKYPDISKTLMIWMDTITHKTRRGESQFGLTNTNKMLKWYSGITGLKTGYTPEAKHCVSATATRDDLGLIAVVMGAQDGKIRFQEAGKLLDYGFANYTVKSGPKVGEILAQSPVKKGDKEQVEMTIEDSMRFVLPKEKSGAEVAYTVSYEEQILAPIYKGQKLGKITYTLNGEVVGEADLVAACDVAKAGFKEMLPYTLKRFFNVSE